MPRHLVSDAHEGMKEIPTVPTWLWSVSLCVTWPACLSQGVCVCVGAVHCLYEKAVSYHQWGLSVVVSVGPFRWPVDLIYKRFWRGE